MPIITKLLISFFCVLFMMTGVIFLWAQNTSHHNRVELPSISQQTGSDDKSSQGEQQSAETHKKRPLLIKQHTRQDVIPIVPPLLSPVKVPQLLSPINDVIPPLQSTIDIQTFPLHLYPEMSFAGIMYSYNQGKIDLDYVVDYLESQHIYNPNIVEKLTPHRAFKHFNKIIVSTDIVKAYAERILAKDPENPDAQLHMLGYEPDNTKEIAGYRKILTKHPNHPETLSKLGYRLLDHSPEEAIQHLRKANLLDPTLGLIWLGIEYERRGNVKTAWFCYKKSITIRNRENWKKRKFPPSQICILYGPYSDESNLRAIDGGKYWKTAIKLVSDPNGTVRRMVTFESVDAQQEREIREFYQFRDWVNNIEKRKLVIQWNNFLVREVEKHLAGGKPMFDPERIVHAYEITTRYPGYEGIQRLKKTDIEVALEIERSLYRQKIN